MPSRRRASGGSAVRDYSEFDTAFAPLTPPTGPSTRNNPGLGIMQEFLRCESEGIVSRPSLGAWLEWARDRKEAAGSRVAPSSTLRARDTDRT